MVRDLLAGLAVWAVLVPQGLAYGELAGLSPVTGLYTAVGALLLYALVGSSRYLHAGPESSVAIVIAAYLGALEGDDPYAMTVGAGTLVCVVAVVRWAPRLPAILVGIAAATAVVALAGWEGELPVVGRRREALG